MDSQTEMKGTGLGQPQTFHTTHWSIILAAMNPDAPGSRAALASFCQSYWMPLYAYVRRRGHEVEDAKDLTQAFFEQVIDKNLLSGVKREGGKFRSFLLTALKHFLINEWHRDRAGKRGGGKQMISIDEAAEEGYQRNLAEHETPESIYERQWALTVLGQVIRKLGEEHTASGKSEVFVHLKGCLPGSEDSSGHYREAAAALNMNEAALRMAVTRLRRRYGEILRAEIASTVASPQDIDDEIAHLIQAVSGS
jgi:RNA polymerase sigma factor (sigma-70 family)